MLDLTEVAEVGKEGLYIRVHVAPGARREGVFGVHGKALKVAVRAAAQKGKANQAVEGLLASILCLPASQVRVVSGHHGRNKKVFVPGDGERLLSALQARLNDAD